MKSVTFGSEHLFKDEIESEVIGYREDLYRKFSRGMTSLLESQRPKKYTSNRGLLDTRKLHRFQTDDSVFYKKTSVPHSDTTFLFLIDNSGSMGGRAYQSDYHSDGGTLNLDRIDTCNAIVSAFAKANKTVLGNRIKMEVFAKSEGGEIMDGFVKGYVPILSRIFSNVKNDTDWDKILRLTTNAPMSVDGSSTGSYTPEFLLLPALMEWCRTNITTRNMVVINLTDGDCVHVFLPKESIAEAKSSGSSWGRGTRASDDDTKMLRIKYLRGVPNTTIFIGDGGEYHTTKIKDIYGTNAIAANDSAFSTELFKVLNNLINQYA